MKNRKFKKFFTAFIGIVSCIAITTPVFADTKNTTTGGVNIDLKTYTSAPNSATVSNNRVEMDEFNDLLPGEIKDYYITVVNNALPSYVRVKTTFNASFAINDVNEILGGISEDWVKKGGYYYYKKALKQNESVDLCKTFKVPNISEGTNNYISLSITADAIQEKNFTPDFDADDPWLGQKIEATRAIGEIYSDERSYPVNCDTNITLTDKEVFKIKGNPMPGDTYKDKITASPKVNGTMHVKLIYNSKDIPEQANLIKLTIMQGSSKCYEGSLFSTQLMTGFDVKNVKKGSKYTFDCTLTLDPTLVNVSEWTEIPVSFYIGADEIEPTSPPILVYNEGDTVINNYITEPAGVLGATLSDIPEQGVLGAIRNNILTGDNAMPVLWFLIGCTTIIAAIVTGIVMAVKKRRG